MKHSIYILCFIFICIPFQAVCQKDYYSDNENEFKFIAVSIGAGGFFANRHVANYYNGTSGNLNKIDYAFRNKQWEEAVRERLIVSKIWVTDEDLPFRMTYNMATAMGFRAAINLSAYTSVFINVNQVNLVAASIFYVNVEGPPNPEFRPRPEGKIWGKESRTILDVGFQWSDDMEPRNWQWFYELAFNITNTKVKENYIEIAGLRQSIVDRGQWNQNHQSFLRDEHYETAFGIGLVGSVGWRYVVNSYASLEFGAAAYLQDINLTDYKKFHPNFNLFARINLLMF
jgi:hypothetical protein